ncbi:MAG: type II toxin-antitoxin system mRNA interferase toxin, RelE/StbE family [Candidatus Paceibacterota bacterium]|jgi:mRNA-degrading endonuclease YafQ of YafQ-DinJ toxin-antitoxin module
MKIEIAYAPSFIRQWKLLPEALQDEALEKIKLFKDRENHKLLKVHKLNGRLQEFYGFSVNYKFRIVFEYGEENTVFLLKIGSHDIYQ